MTLPLLDVLMLVLLWRQELKLLTLLLLSLFKTITLLQLLKLACGVEIFMITFAVSYNSNLLSILELYLFALLVLLLLMKVLLQLFSYFGSILSWIHWLLLLLLLDLPQLSFWIDHLIEKRNILFLKRCWSILQVRRSSKIQFYMQLFLQGKTLSKKLTKTINQ